MIDHIRRLSTKYQNLVSRKGVRLLGWVSATSIFAVAGLISYRSLPKGIETDVAILLAAIAMVPVTVGLTSAEVFLLGRLSGVSFRWNETARIVLNGAIANLAPVPGSFAVRLGAVRARGGSISKAASSSVVMAMVWLAVGLVAGGTSIALTTGSVWSWPILVAGLAIGFSATWGIARMRSGEWSIYVVAVETSLVLSSALLSTLVMSAIGYTPNYGQALVITMSQIISTVLGFFPAGLGIGELLAGMTAPLTGLESSVGVVVAMVHRVIRLSTLAVIRMLTPSQILDRWRPLAR